ncbi:amidohydrolase family protein [Jiangella endophytica]|uniref:amidohydrolase family protein n=1 Tax=Jiangella endophytica TaxID=1623398 RepID=UPI000E350FCD|nr:amidohydrolase family protein [Jiangella endophytica]
MRTTVKTRRPADETAAAGGEPVVDCHVHLWDPALGFGWIRPGSPHHRPFALDDLAASAGGTGVVTSVLVEASRGDAGETAALRAAARRRPDLIGGYVGNLHCYAGRTPRQFAALLRRWGDARPVGMRAGGGTWADVPPGVAALLPVLADHGVVLELNMGAGAVRVGAELTERHPGLVVVLDHLGNPPNVAHADPGDWLNDLDAAAGRPNVVIKVSGLLTQQRGAAPADVDRLVAAALTAVGAQRCMIGSDWPICLPAGSRASSLTASARTLDDLCAEDRAMVRRGTALRVYGLPTAEVARWTELTRDD